MVLEIDFHRSKGEQSAIADEITKLDWTRRTRCVWIPSQEKWVSCTIAAMTTTQPKPPSGGVVTYSYTSGSNVSVSFCFFLDFSFGAIVRVARHSWSCLHTWKSKEIKRRFLSRRRKKTVDKCLLCTWVMFTEKKDVAVRKCKCVDHFPIEKSEAWEWFRCWRNERKTVEFNDMLIQHTRVRWLRQYLFRFSLFLDSRRRIGSVYLTLPSKKRKWKKNEVLAQRPLAINYVRADCKEKERGRERTRRDAAFKVVMISLASMSTTDTNIDDNETVIEAQRETCHSSVSSPLLPSVLFLLLVQRCRIFILH